MFKRLKLTTIESYIGRPFFYADSETGIGWESTVDGLMADELSDSYKIELSCGTVVKMSRRDLLKFRESPTLTNTENYSG